MQQPEKITKANYILLVLFGLVVLSAAVFFYRNWLEWQDEIQRFKDSKINSRIIGLKNLNRGSFKVQLIVNGKPLNFNLSIAYEVKRDSIAVGDSLAKEARNAKFEVFRLKEKGKVKKISEISIY